MMAVTMRQRKPDLVPVHLGLFPWLELQGHEHLLLPMGRLLHVSLYRPVMSVKPYSSPRRS